MSAAPRFPSAKLRGVIGDNHDRDRLVLSFDMPDGMCTHLSVSIDDLNALGEMVEWAIPNFAELWRKRDEAQE